MANPNVQLNEEWTGLAAVDPQSVATGAAGATSAYTLARGYRRFVGIGVVTTLTGTLTVTLIQATSGAGAGAKTLGTATTLVCAAASGQAVVEAMEDDLDTANGFYYVAVRVAHNHAGNRDCAGWIGGLNYVC